MLLFKLMRDNKKKMFSENCSFCPQTLYTLDLYNLLTYSTRSRINKMFTSARAKLVKVFFVVRGVRTKSNCWDCGFEEIFQKITTTTTTMQQCNIWKKVSSLTHISQMVYLKVKSFNGCVVIFFFSDMEKWWWVFSSIRKISGATYDICENEEHSLNSKCDLNEQT